MFAHLEDSGMFKCEWHDSLVQMFMLSSNNQQRLHFFLGTGSELTPVMVQIGGHSVC